MWFQKLIVGGKVMVSGTVADYPVGDDSPIQCVSKLIRIFVRDGNQHLDLEVCCDETIDSLKAKIERKTGKPAEGQWLSVGGKVMKAGTLEDFSVGKGREIRCDAKVIQIFVLDLSGCHQTLQVSRDESIASLRVKVQGKTGVPPDKQTLLFAGKVLDDKTEKGVAKTLEDFEIQRDSTLNLTLGLPGGWMIPEYRHF